MTILRIEHALDDATCEALMEAYDRRAGQAVARDHTGHPVVYCHAQASDAVHAERAAIRTMVQRCVESMGGPLYPETVVLATMGSGGYHPRHADNAMPSPDGRWVPNHTPMRHVSGIFYLNSDFEGGEIVFVQHDLTVKPRRGLLLAFPSDEHHVHEVMPVLSGKRYTMPVWLTRDACHACTPEWS